MASLHERKLAIVADLHWSLEEMRAKEAGKQFLLNVAQFLPVYSPALRQIYSDYTTYFTKTSVVILPDPVDFTCTYSHIPEESIKSTGLLLYPSADGLAVNMRLRNKKNISMPLQKAFGLIQQQLRGPFLPIIKRGDLRDFKELTPCLHLNALVPNKAGSLSRFSQRDIAKALAERSNELQLAAHLLGA